MQKKMQRLFSVLFALVLTMALVTIAAGAEDQATEISTVEQLKEAAETGGNFKLTADLTVDEIIVIQISATHLATEIITKLQTPIERYFAASAINFIESASIFYSFLSNHFRLQKPLLNIYSLKC